MGNPFDPLNLILFLIAVVGFIRLRMILGRRTGNEDPLSQNKYASRVSADIEALSKSRQKKQPKNKDDVLQFLSNEFPEFNKESFIDGASNAYEMILKDYADGDLKSIKNIISKDVYDGFNEAIIERKNNNKKLVNELIAFDKSDIIGAKIERKSALLTVEFYSRIITYVLDENNQVIEGSKDNPISVIDQWTFKKALKDKSPSWQLISTQSEI
tara:strand:+ start:253 stop:894 length:642 start_codon:yes stop_codon:yes gene_type:complete